MIYSLKILKINKLKRMNKKWKYLNKKIKSIKLKKTNNYRKNN